MKNVLIKVDLIWLVRICHTVNNWLSALHGLQLAQVSVTPENSLLSTLNGPS